MREGCDNDHTFETCPAPESSCTATDFTTWTPYPAEIGQD
jgi:hypothetical protein